MGFNIYEEVTNRIMEQLEKGVIPWRKTWNGSEPINYVTRKAYRGINLLLLPYGGEWLTFLQAKQTGGNVKRGEKASMVVFYKLIDKENENGEKETYPIIQYSNVFHISQCEGITSKLQLIEESDIEPIQEAQKILDSYISRSSVKLEYIEGSNRACYSPSQDKITMPVIKQFDSAKEFYSTAFHEAAHSTGHKTRLDREELTTMAAFGSQTYSKEELTAEITASMVMNIAGIELPQTFENSVAYIKSWIRKLRDDKKMIVSASVKAQKATDLILGITAKAEQ